MIPSPTDGHGWSMADGGLQIVWRSKEIAPLSVLQVRLTTPVSVLCIQCIYFNFRGHEKIISERFSSK